MPRDTNFKMIKKSTSKQSKKYEEDKRKRKMNASSDSGSDSDDSSYHTDDSDEDTLDIQEYRKLLSQLYPSKHIQKKVKAGKNIKQVLDKELQDESDDEDEDNEDKRRSDKKKSKKQDKKRKHKKQVSESEHESSENSDDESLGSRDADDGSFCSDDDDECHKVKSVKGNKLNIIFTIGNSAEEDDDDEEYYDEDEEIWETASNNSTENEDDPVSTDASSDEEDDDKTDESETECAAKQKNKKKDKNKDKSNDKGKDKEKENKKSKNKPSNADDKDLIDQLKNIVQEAETSSGSSKDSKNEGTAEANLLETLKKLHDENKDNEIVKECLRICEEKMQKNIKKDEKKIKKTKDRNERIFRKIMYDKNTMNDFEFFNKMEITDQKKIIKELREINKISRIEKPYRLTLLEADIPVMFKSIALKKICNLRQMDPGSSEYYKIKNWVDTFMQIPFGKYNTLPINISDGVENCHNFMENAQKTLDTAVYGLNDAKMQIMQMLGQFITNPKSIGSAIAIHGPPGTGKTSLVKEGISKILNRPFAFIALGGATDSSFLEGHGYTYEGSTWGKIVQILIDSKCMNPVIYFDELDKISETPKGEEIAGILTHLTDTSQNSQFHDKYFSEIDFDLSKCLFIFSYNDESKVNPILKDRMYRIQTKGYNQKQKTTISKEYLLPKIREQIRFTSDEIIIPDTTIHYIIENHCDKEDGVRNLKRCMEIIHTKLNLYRLMKPGSNLFEEDMSLAVKFPFTVTKDIVDKLIKDKKEINTALSYLYV
jgi:ATP-dependent Lon protease